MKKGYLEGKHPGVQFLVLLLWVFVSGIIGMLLSISLGTTIWAKEFMLALMGNEQGPMFYYANLFLIFFQHVSFFIIPALLFVYGFQGSWIDFFQLKKGLLFWQWVLIIFLYIFKKNLFTKERYFLIYVSNQFHILYSRNLSAFISIQLWALPNLLCQKSIKAHKTNIIAVKRNLNFDFNKFFIS